MTVLFLKLASMNGSDLYGYIKFMIQSGPHMGCRTSSLGCKEFWPSESRDSYKQICKKITGGLVFTIH